MGLRYIGFRVPQELWWVYIQFGGPHITILPSRDNKARIFQFKVGGRPSSKNGSPIWLPVTYSHTWPLKRKSQPANPCRRLFGCTHDSRTKSGHHIMNILLRNSTWRAHIGTLMGGCTGLTFWDPLRSLPLSTSKSYLDPQL